MPLAPDPVRHNRLVDVARLYYLRELTHQQIADRLGLSRVKVTRLLRQAVEEGIVEFHIADPVVDTLDLQDRLEDRFGLRQAVVVPAAEDEAQLLDRLGRFAAAWLDERLVDGLVVGLGWGRTLNAMAPHLARSGRAGVLVVSLTGGLAANRDQPNPYDTVTAVAARLGAEPRYLLVPAVTDSPAARDLLLREASARAVTGLWERVAIAMLSIGLLAPDTGVFPSLEDPAAGVRAAEAEGGVGDILAGPFDTDGRPVLTELRDRTIAIEPERLGRIPLVAGVAGGAAKAGAILGALRTGLISVLITDETAARLVLRRAGGAGDTTGPAAGGEGGPWRPRMGRTGAGPSATATSS